MDSICHNPLFLGDTVKTKAAERHPAGWLTTVCLILIVGQRRHRGQTDGRTPDMRSEGGGWGRGRMYTVLEDKHSLPWCPKNGRPQRDQHYSAQIVRFKTNSSKDSGTMALLVDHFPIIHHQATNCISTSARDMGTLIYNFWQPWNKKYGFMGFRWC